MHHYLALLDLFCTYYAMKTAWAIRGSGHDFFICLSLGLSVLTLTHAVFVVFNDRSSAERRHARHVGFAISGLVAVGVTLCCYLSIKKDTNSTAAIGFILLPFIFGIQALFFYYVGWGLGIMTYQLRAAAQRRRAIIFGLGIVYVLIAATGVAEGMKIITDRSIIERIATMQADQLHEIIRDPRQNTKRWVLNALACNPQLSQEDLFFLANLPDKELHERGSPMVVPDACNHKGLAVMRLVALHPNVGPETLELLSRSQDEYVLMSVASNPKTPEDILKRLRENPSPTVQLAFRQDAQRQEPANAREHLPNKESIQKNTLASHGASAVIDDVDAEHRKKILNFLKNHPVDRACSADIMQLSKYTRPSFYAMSLLVKRALTVFIQADKLTTEQRQMLAATADLLQKNTFKYPEMLSLEKKYELIFVTAEKNAAIQDESAGDSESEQPTSLGDKSRAIMVRQGLIGHVADDINKLIAYDRDIVFTKFMLARQALVILEQPQDLDLEQKTMLAEAASLVRRQNLTMDDYIIFHKRYHLMLLRSREAALLAKKVKKVKHTKDR